MAEYFITPGNIEEAVKFKDKDNAYLAGGTEINRLNSSVKADELIFIGGLGIDSINKAEVEGKNYIRVGATATFTECIANDKVPAYFKECCRFLSSSVRRNMATIGGNVALCRDDSYLIPVLVASKALVEFALGELTDISTYVNEHEKFENRLIEAIYLDPASDVRTKRYSNTAASHAFVTVAYSSEEIAVQIKGAGLVDISDLKKSKDLNEQFCLDWAKKLNNKKIVSDMYGSAEYKRYLAGVTVAMLAAKGDSK